MHTKLSKSRVKGKLDELGQTAALNDNDTSRDRVS